MRLHRNDIRASFEKWQRDTGRTDDMWLEQRDGDNYGLNALQSEWEVWMAAAAATEPTDYLQLRDAIACFFDPSATPASALGLQMSFIGKAYKNRAKRIKELEAALSTETEARIHAQRELYAAQEARNRAGVEVRRQERDRFMAERAAYLAERARNEELVAILEKAIPVLSAHKAHGWYDMEDVIGQAARAVKRPPAEWPEERVDVIGQNGNDGLHYQPTNGEK